MEQKKEEHLRKRFHAISQEATPRRNLLLNCCRAFLVGGLICDVGQFFQNVFLTMGLPKEEASAWGTIMMVFMGALMTGIGVYDKIAAFGGAGTVVPITGFSNAVVAPAMEYKYEGFIFGVAARMFTIAGPVLVYGICTSVLVGIFHYIIKNFV